MVIKITNLYCLVIVLALSSVALTVHCPHSSHKAKAHHAIKSLAQLENSLEAVSNPLSTTALAQSKTKSHSHAKADSDLFWKKKKKAEVKANSKTHTAINKEGYHCVTKQRWAQIQTQLTELKRLKANLAKSRAHRRRRRRHRRNRRRRRRLRRRKHRKYVSRHHGYNPTINLNNHGRPIKNTVMQLAQSQSKWGHYHEHDSWEHHGQPDHVSYDGKEHPIEYNEKNVYHWNHARHHYMHEQKHDRFHKLMEYSEHNAHSWNSKPIPMHSLAYRDSQKLARD